MPVERQRLIKVGGYHETSDSANEVYRQQNAATKESR